jgi:hypothetical protein
LVLTGNWIEFVVNVPLAAWHIHLFVATKHLFDATEIFQRLSQQKKINLIKLGFYMVLFFYFLYDFVVSLVQNGGLKRRNFD